MQLQEHLCPNSEMIVVHKSSPQIGVGSNLVDKLPTCLLHIPTSCSQRCRWSERSEDLHSLNVIAQCLLLRMSCSHSKYNETFAKSEEG
jgi:hypothetical protein